MHYQPRHVNEIEALDIRKDANDGGKQAKKSELFVSYGDSALMNAKC